MGHIFTPPLNQLAEFCAKTLEIDVFVETGTFRGESAAWAAPRFRRVVTIEASALLHNQARTAASAPNIEFVCGQSEDVLGPLLGRISESKLIWLDAHWCGDGNHLAAGQDGQCPLLKELESLGDSPSDDVVLIDDFHMFALPPPAPFRLDQWPDMETIFHSLGRLRSDRRTFLYHNVLVIAFGRHIAVLQQFLRERRK